MRILYVAARIATTEASSRAPPVVAQQHARDQRRMLSRKPRIGREIPAAGQSVGVQDQQRIGGEVVGELADARRDVSGRAVVRDHVPRLSGIDEHAR